MLPATLSVLSEEGLRADKSQEMSCLLLLGEGLGEGWEWEWAWAGSGKGDKAIAFVIDGDADEEEEEEVCWVVAWVATCKEDEWGWEWGWGLEGMARVTLRWC